MWHLTSLQKLVVNYCDSIQALPEWLSDLASLKEIFITNCDGIESLPDSMNRLTRLEKLRIYHCPKLSQWCGLEENRMKLAHIKEKVYALLYFLSCFSYWTTTFSYLRCWLCLLCRDFINVESSLKFGLVKFAVYFQRVAPLQLNINRISWTIHMFV